MSKLVVVLVLLLLPGIFATVISDKLTHHSKWDSFKYTLYALVLGVFTCTIVQIGVYAYDIYSYRNIGSLQLHSLSIWGAALDDKVKFNSWEVVVATVLSMPVAFLAAFLVNTKKINKLGSLLHVTTKYGDENLYSYYLNAKEIEWVYVREREADLTYEGQVVSYAENDKIQEIVLSNVRVYSYKDSAFLYEVPTIYISREMGKFTIEAVPTSYLEK